MYPQVFGKYVLERELARGGMARVMLATLRGAGGFEKRLVVKQIRDELASDDEFVRRFVDEAKTTVTLAHPNIVPVYELGVELGTYFLAMEFVEGLSLAELLRTLAAEAQTGVRPGLTPEEGAYVGVEVCRALDYAHRRMNVVHRDVTPRNVMVDEEGQVKVIDFGIAAPVATAPSGQGVFGSPGHMPPEQMQGLELTPAADVFAVAALLMELWSGKAPFRRATIDEIEATMRGPGVKPSAADIRLLPLDDVFANAMALDPAARPQQADDLGRSLRKFLVGIDLGDVSRQLGERVRAARAHPAPPPPDPRPVLQRPPSRPTATQVGTKTFAARAEMQALASAAPEPEVSTRRLASSGPGPARDAEAAALQPLEADPRRDPDHPTPRRRAGWLGAIGAAALAVTAFFLGRAVTHPTRSTDASAQIEALAPAPAQTTALSGAASANSAPAAPDTPAPTAAPAPVERAQLVLLGDGTVVHVDGVARGACPVRAAVEPGPHVVVFSFPATGESKAERLSLRPGEHATLRADFTGAVPTLRVDTQ